MIQGELRACRLIEEALRSCFSSTFGVKLMPGHHSVKVRCANVLFCCCLQTFWCAADPLEPNMKIGLSLATAAFLAALLSSIDAQGKYKPSGLSLPTHTIQLCPVFISSFSIFSYLHSLLKLLELMWAIHHNQTWTVCTDWIKLLLFHMFDMLTMWLIPWCLSCFYSSVVTYVSIRTLCLLWCELQIQIPLTWN